ncbi:MAG: CPBP family intramembrane glutamic endopeptidase [Pseudoxanthomonas sp.]
MLAATWLLASHAAFAEDRTSAQTSMDATGAAVATIDDAAELQAVQAAKTLAYQQALTRYSEVQKTAPEDAGVAVSRCRFISNFTDEDYGEWIESAPDDYEACLAGLRTRWSARPEAQLYLFEQNWDEDVLAQGEALLKNSDAWPVPLRQRLLAAQSGNYADDEQPRPARRLALQAARLGHAESVPLAVEQLIAQGDEAGAAALLRDTPAATVVWQAGKRLQAALMLKDPKVALGELGRYAGADFKLEPAIVARVQLRAGNGAAALAALKDSPAGDEKTRQARFDTALANRNPGLAAAQVDITDMDELGANLQRFAVLATQWPRALFTGPMLLTLLVAGLIVIALGLLPGAVLLPVHYRGLWRRARGRAPVAPFPTIGLRHAWWGLFLLLCIPLLTCGLLEPDSLATLLGGQSLPPAGPLFRITLWSTVVSLVLLFPLTYRMGRTAVFGNPAMLRQAGWVLAALVALYAVAYLQGAWNQWRAGDNTTLQTQMVDMLVNGGTSRFGFVPALLLVAALVPVLEESVFRGLLLGGMARHISFGWSNLIQALLFAAVHDDPPRFFFYLAMGLLAGGLVRKTKSLGPAIALHALNNCLAFLMLSL